ncbi:hypothetical protein Ddc_15227 [Ditylenchus destructor]|nr:hypothetical protein Ddc_15227 [Ditylenchus destructor]
MSTKPERYEREKNELKQEAEPVLRRWKRVLDRKAINDIKDHYKEVKCKPKDPEESKSRLQKCRTWAEKPRLLQRIGLILYGTPNNSIKGNGNNEQELLDAEKQFSLYPEDKRKNITKMAQRLEKYALRGSENRLEFSQKLISIKRIKNGGKVTYHPLLILRYHTQNPKAGGKKELVEKFVDQKGRVYGNFDDFLKNNKLPKCVICYLDESGELIVDESIALKRKWRRRALLAIDGAVTVAAVGAGIVGAVVTAPAVVLTGGAVAAGTGAYFVARNTKQIIDKGTHGQSVNPLTNWENAFLWGGTALGVLGGVASAVGTLAATKVISGNLALKAAKAQLGRAVLNIFGKEEAIASSAAAEVAAEIALFGARAVIYGGMFELSSTPNELLSAKEWLSHDAPYEEERIKLRAHLKPVATMMFFFHNVIVPLETMEHLLLIFFTRNPDKEAVDEHVMLEVMEEFYVYIRELDMILHPGNPQYDDNERPLIDLTKKKALVGRLKEEVERIRAEGG